MNNFGLINVLKETKYTEKQDFVFSYNTYTLIEKLRGSENPISRSILTNEEAIVCAAKNYSLDVTSSICPSREILEITKGGNYKPILDDSFAHNYKLNPHFYDLTKFWK